MPRSHRSTRGRTRSSAWSWPASCSAEGCRAVGGSTYRAVMSALPEVVATHIAPNYHPLPVVVAEAAGCWVTDADGRRYLDFLSAYSALNFGHAHPVLLD